MNILIIGKSGTGKTNLVGLLMNMIFKKDKDCTVITNDPDKEIKSLGNGSTKHSIFVKQVSSDSDVSNFITNTEERKKYDLIITTEGQGFYNWIENIKS